MGKAPWSNWSGFVQCHQGTEVAPADEDALRDVIRTATSLRPRGSGHSFSPLVPGTGQRLSLEGMQGLVSHDRDACVATVHAGTILHSLGPLLAEIGQALPNMGDIDKQSIGGAISTATHGTGITLGAIASGVAKLRLVLADGEVLECSPEHDSDVFRAACVSLGSVAVMSQITLRNIPAFRIKERTQLMLASQFIQDVEALQAKHRHVEAWVFPFGGKAIVKTSDITEAPETKYVVSDFSENTLLEWAAELSRALPFGVPFFQKCLGIAISDETRIGPSYGIFATERRVRFNEMEYHVPAAQGPACLEQVCSALKASEERPFFPVEYRYVNGDDLMLSPFNGGARASIAVHQYVKQPPWSLFNAVEPVFQSHQGRPHWGKMHSLGAKDLREMYPEWEAFHGVRKRLDPKGKFMNEYLRKIFEG
jgi:FAD-linked oxidoreductase